MKISPVKSIFAFALFGSLIFVPRISAQQPPSDANIGAIVLAADQIDIDYANIALSKSKNKDVRDFAQQMATDHAAVQKSVVELAGKLKLTPVDDATSNGLKSKSVEVKAKLNSLQGKAFDKYYIDNEVAYHTTVIDAVSKVLIPNAQNAELKSALQGALPLFQGHLEHAQKVQAGLDSAAKGGSKYK